MLKVVQEGNESNRDEPAGGGASLLDEIVRDGTRHAIAPGNCLACTTTLVL